MAFAPLLALAFQCNSVQRMVVNANPKLFSGVCAVFILMETAVIHIIKIQTANAVASGISHMAVQRNQPIDAVLQHLDLRYRYLVF